METSDKNLAKQERKGHGEKIVWVACRASEDCDGKESVLLSAVKTGDQSSVNLVRYR